MLNFHNEKRRVVSTGKQNYQGGAMPTAKNMNELVSDSPYSLRQRIKDKVMGVNQPLPERATQATSVHLGIESVH